MKGTNEPFWGIIEPLQGMIEEPVQGTNELHVGNDTIQTPLIDQTSAKAVVSEQYVRTKNCFNDYNFSIDFLESCGTILNKTLNACRSTLSEIARQSKVKRHRGPRTIQNTCKEDYTIHEKEKNLAET